MSDILDALKQLERWPAQPKHYFVVCHPADYDELVRQMRTPELGFGVSFTVTRDWKHAVPRGEVRIYELNRAIFVGRQLIEKPILP